MASSTILSSPNIAHIESIIIIMTETFRAPVMNIINQVHSLSTEAKVHDLVQTYNRCPFYKVAHGILSSPSQCTHGGPEKSDRVTLRLHRGETGAHPFHKQGLLYRYPQCKLSMNLLSDDTFPYTHQLL